MYVNMNFTWFPSFNSGQDTESFSGVEVEKVFE